MLIRSIRTGLFSGLMLCALVSLLPACKGEPAPVTPTTAPKAFHQTSKPASSPEVASAFTPWKAGKTPKGVLGVLGVSSVRTLLQELTVLGAEVAPGEIPSDLASEVIEGIRDGFGFTDVGWLIRDAPVRAVVTDPVAYPGVVLLILPIVAEADVAKTYRATSRADVEGHAAVWDHRGEPVCVDYLPGHVVISRDLKSYDALRPFIANAVLRWTPKATVNLALESRRIQEVFSEELAELKAALSDDEVDASLAPYAQFGLSLLEQTEQIVMGLQVRGGVLESTVAIQGERGSDVDVLTQAAKGRHAPLKTAMPEEAWLTVSSDVDLRPLRVVDALERLYFKRMVPPGPPGRALRARAYALFERLRALDTGPIVLGMYREGAFPFATLLTTAVNDSASVSRVSDDLLRLAFLSLRDLVQQTLASAEIDVELDEVDSLEAFIPLINDVASPLGIEMTWVEKRTDSLLVRGVRVDVDWSKTGLKELDEALYQTLRDTLGPRIELAQVVHGAQLAIAFGPSAIQTVRQSVDRAPAKASAKALNDSQKEALTVRLRLGALWRAFAFLPSVRELGAIDHVGFDQAMLIGLRATDRGLVGSIRLPMSLLKAFVNLTL